MPDDETTTQDAGTEVTQVPDLTQMPDLLEDMMMIVTVLLPQHEDRSHTYNFPKGTAFADVLREIRAINALIQQSVMREIKVVPLLNPSTLYNTDQVIGFETKLVGQRELTEALEASQRRVGFVPN